MGLLPGSEFDEDGLRTVEHFDSKVPDHLRQPRVQWLNTPLNDKLHWTQTSTDIHAFVKVPEGTRGRDLEVCHA